MRVAVDARELEGRPTGVGRVVQGLLGAWPVDELILISRRPVGLPPGLATRGTVRTHVADDGAWMPGVLWEQLVLPRAVRRAQADAMIAPGYGMPGAVSVPTAVCMHDCAPFAVPDEFGWRERARRRWSARHAARRAAFLFMGTQFAADEACRYLRASPDDCLVAPWGLTGQFGVSSPESIATVRARYDVDDQTVLFVGSGFRRRALVALAGQVAEVARTRTSARLVVAGQGHEDNALPGVRSLGFVPDADLPALYAAAGVVAYPSSYEGFGLPVLEALACGARVVASRATALAEVFEGRATLVPHGDDAAWVDALTKSMGSTADEEPQQWAVAQTWEATSSAVRDRLLACVGAAR